MMMIKFFKRFAFVVFGSILMSLGIAQYISAGLGVDPLSMFISGLSTKIGFTVGQTSIMIMAVIMMFLLFIERKRIGPGTFVNAILVGVFIDIFLSVSWLHPSNLYVAALELVLAIVFTAIGIGIYISGGLGEGAVDALMIVLNHRTHIHIRWVKVGMDITLVIIGWLIGGKFGIGTILGAMATGPVIEWTISKVKPLVSMA